MSGVWLRNEDRAVKAKFVGLTVDDANSGPNGRPVSVRFADPQTEFSKLTFPVILVQRTGMLKMDEREHRGQAAVTYWPEGNGRQDDSRDDPSSAPRVEYPIPMDVTYQITVHTRTADHQMELAVDLQQPDRIPPRFGYLEVPEDGTVRSLFIDAGPEYTSGKDSDGKRIMTTTYLLRVPTELPPSMISGPQVETINTEIGLLDQ